jgi:hypothetical protein
LKNLLFEMDKRFARLDISRYSLRFSLVISNYSFFHNLIRLPLVILNLRASSRKSSFKPLIIAQLMNGEIALYLTFKLMCIAILLLRLQIINKLFLIA